MTHVEHGAIDEIEADATYTHRVHSLQVGIGRLRGGHGDTAERRPGPLQRVAEHSVVCAVDARLHQDGAIDAAPCHHLTVAFEAGRIGRIGATSVERIGPHVADHVDVGVATVRWHAHLMG